VLTDEERELYISTHALVQRAASVSGVRICDVDDFNPRPRAEGGAPPRQVRRQPVYFNPRPRAEGGTLPLPSEAAHPNFNPRPRAEGGPTRR